MANNRPNIRGTVIKKISTMAANTPEGEVEAWTLLSSNLKLCGIIDTMQEWELSKEPSRLPGNYCNYIFTRP